MPTEPTQRPQPPGDASAGNRPDSDDCRLPHVTHEHGESIEIAPSPDAYDTVDEASVESFPASDAPAW